MRITDGKYIGETGIISAVNKENISMPTVKLNASQREIEISSSNIKLKNDRDNDDLHLMQKRIEMNTRGHVGGDSLQMVK